MLNTNREYATKLGKLYNADCIDIMQTLSANSVDMILCDLPYGTTELVWDKRIPMEILWREYLRITKPSSAIVLTGQQPFTTDLINAGRKFFRYELIWEKPCALGFLNAKKMPLRSHEDIIVFYRKLPTYNPQMTFGGKAYSRKVNPDRCRLYGGQKSAYNSVSNGERYPRSVLRFGKDGHSGHPTEKPLKLFEWLVRTYMNEGDIVLDNCIGSGTTAIACEQSNRRWVGVEKERIYYDMTIARLQKLLQT